MDTRGRALTAPELAGQSVHFALAWLKIGRRHLAADPAAPGEATALLDDAMASLYAADRLLPPDPLAACEVDRLAGQPTPDAASAAPPGQEELPY